MPALEVECVRVEGFRITEAEADRMAVALAKAFEEMRAAALEQQTAPENN